MVQNVANIAQNAPKKEVQVKSAERVKNHGEVLTARREVEAMLDLVKNESERIDSRFLEPACGDGNFLVAILERKLKTVLKKYKTKQSDFEVQMLLALSSIYGIDLLKDNIERAKNRMLKIALDYYNEALKITPDTEFQNIMRFILNKNILQGDSLNGINKIIFTQWTLVGYQFKREEYSFAQMNLEANTLDTPLFASLTNEKKEEVFIPKPINEFPLTFYRKLGN